MKERIITWVLAILCVVSFAWASNTYMHGGYHFYGDNIGLIFEPSTASDTAWWLAPVHDSEGDDDDPYCIGRGTTIGSNILFTLTRDGNLSVASLTPSGLTASRAVQTDASKNIESSAVTTTELGYLSGVTAAIQGQLDARCLESVFGTAIGAGLTLDGTTLKTGTELQGLAGLSGTGLVAHTAAGTYTERTISGTANQITVTNGDGVAGNPVLSTPQDLATSSSPAFSTVKLSGLTDGYIPYHVDDSTGLADSPLKRSSASSVAVKADNGALIYEPATAGETGFWHGPVHDSEGDDDDYWALGTGTTPGSNTALAVDKDGKVGIGTASPSSIFELYKADATTWTDIQSTYVYTPAPQELLIKNPTLNTTGTYAGIFLSPGQTADGTQVNAAHIGAIRESTDASTAIVFSTRQTSGANSERMRIDSSGKVGVGTTTPGYPLHVVGNAYFSADVSALTFTDRTPFYDGDALTAIKNIKGVDGQIDHSTLPEFARRTLQRKGTDPETGKQVVISEEPGRNLGSMISVNTRGVQQLIALVEAMAVTIDRLEDRIYALEKMVPVETGTLLN